MLLVLNVTFNWVTLQLYRDGQFYCETEVPEINAVSR
jgi:hypothetical protein